LDDQVRVVKVEGDKAPPLVRQGVKFLDADFYLDDSIDITTRQLHCSAAAADGIIYGLKTPTWHMFTLGHDAAAKRRATSLSVDRSVSPTKTSSATSWCS
jgi:hypothetical protein